MNKQRVQSQTYSISSAAMMTTTASAASASNTSNTSNNNNDNYNNINNNNNNSDDILHDASNQPYGTRSHNTTRTTNLITSGLPQRPWRQPLFECQHHQPTQSANANNRTVTVSGMTQSHSARTMQSSHVTARMRCPCVIIQSLQPPALALRFTRVITLGPPAGNASRTNCFRCSWARVVDLCAPR